MGIDNNSFKSKSVEYETPTEIVEPLIEEFNIVLDVCATRENAQCAYFITKYQDAFTKDWSEHGNCWMNPPWGRGMKKWVERAREESRKGIVVVCLLPVRSNTIWWHKNIIDTKAEVRFLKGEIKFNKMERGLWLPCAIVIFRPSDFNPKTKVRE